MTLFVDSSTPRDVGDGIKTVTTAGTRVQLTTTKTVARLVLITALSTNTGTVVIGSSTVVAAAATRRGAPLRNGDSIVLPAPSGDLSGIYLDSTVSGEGVSFLYIV